MSLRFAIFGAGITGLTAARELLRAGHDVDVYEADNHVGGLASTFRDSGGFIYDNGPHFIFSTLAEKLGIADICRPVKYYEHLYVGNRYYRFPFGFIQNPLYAASAGLATLTRTFHRTPANLGEFLRVYYGRRFSRDVLAPLIEKWSGVPSAEMSLDFAHRLLPTNVSYMIYSVLKRIRGGITEDYYRKGRYIVYPRGSISRLFDVLCSEPGLRLHLNHPVDRLEADGDRLRAAYTGNRRIEADHFLSTMPITHLAFLLDQAGIPTDWDRFRYRGILILFIKLSRRSESNDLARLPVATNVYTVYSLV